MARIARLTGIRRRPTVLGMSRSSLLLSVFVLVLQFCAVAWTPAEAGRPYYEEARRPFIGLGRGPVGDDPASQLAHAEALQAAGRVRRAERALRVLVRYWPNTVEAAEAQWAYAESLKARGRSHRAYEAFSHLLEEYSGKVPHEEILDQQFRLALAVMEQRRGAWLFLPGFEAPERALPLLENLVRFGPRWDYAPAAQLLIAQIHEFNSNDEEAVFAYEKLETRYPNSPEAVTAAYGRARVLSHLARRYSRHIDGVETAYIASGMAVQRFPDAVYREEAIENMRELRQIMAQAAYDKAHYYDRIARSPEAAIIAYERFLEQFPEADLTETARARLRQLQQKVHLDRNT